ncbi:MAG: hypothetical protein ACLGI7_11330 [Gammaproteobacteria bacterium]
MYRFRATQLRGPRCNGDFLKALHHLRHLGCETQLQRDGDSCVADLSYDGAPNACMRDEIERTLQQLSDQLSEPGVVSLCTDDGERERYIGPRAEQLSRLVCLQRAALYAERAGERRLSQALRRRYHAAQCGSGCTAVRQ